MTAVKFTHIYVGNLNPELKGRRCRILKTWAGPLGWHARHNCSVEFRGGQVKICPIRCLRKIN